MKYEPSEKDASNVANNFVYHSPRVDQLPRYEVIRSSARELAYLLASNCPASRELSLALTNLEQTVMWANAAISRNEE